MELINFEKPARYLGKEWNVIKKDWERNNVRFLLIYPDIYEIGESNLGLKILYDVLNRIDGVLCERSYMPGKDMLLYLKNRGKSIFSLENKKDLKDFDVVGFSISSELLITNVLGILDVSGIPLFRSKRNSFPLICAGGESCINPLPFEEFFDFIFIGEADEAIREIASIIKEGKGLKKDELLKRISEIEGVYVPEISEEVKKRYVDINKNLLPENYVMPLIRSEHDRLTVEVMRGCTRRCKFCQAKKYYFPLRIRKKENVINFILKQLDKTGYEEVSLAGLNVTEHPEIEDIISELIKYFKNKAISISIPSMGCTKRAIEVCKKLFELKRVNLTFAPEVANENIRKKIGKVFDEEEFLRELSDLRYFGVRRVKLYFILGLPYEGSDNIDELSNMIKRWRRATKLEFNLSFSFLVPKSHTEFERTGFKGIDYFEEKTKEIRKKIKAKINFHDLKKSFLEAVISRGDRGLNSVIYRASKKGSIFDEWKEVDNFKIWIEAFGEEGIDPYELAGREIKDKLPWSFIKC